MGRFFSCPPRELPLHGDGISVRKRWNISNGQNMFMFEGFTGEFCQRRIRDCKEDYDLGYQGKKEYMVQPLGHNQPMSVLCDMAYGVTYIQTRLAKNSMGSANRQSYRAGFSGSNEEYWIGNENLHHITKQGTYLLDMMITYAPSNISHARYFKFRIGSEEEDYPILFDSAVDGSSLGAIFCSDNSSLSLNGTTFSTFDHGVEEQIAGGSVSGWWFKPACLSDMNGITQMSQMMQISKEQATENIIGTFIVMINTGYYQDFNG